MTYSKKLLKNLYRTMVRIRLCEEGLVEPILKMEIRTPCHLYYGQEAVAAGVGVALKKEDYVVKEKLKNKIRLLLDFVNKEF